MSKHVLVTRVLAWHGTSTSEEEADQACAGDTNLARHALQNIQAKKRLTKHVLVTRIWRGMALQNIQAKKLTKHVLVTRVWHGMALQNTQAKKLTKHVLVTRTKHGMGWVAVGVGGNGCGGCG